MTIINNDNFIYDMFPYGNGWNPLFSFHNRKTLGVLPGFYQEVKGLKNKIYRLNIKMAFITDAITTEQRYSRKQLGKIWAQREMLDVTVVAILDSLYKNRNKGSIEGSTNVTYKLSTNKPGKLGYGRLYGSKGSLETLEGDCRGTICDDYYYDIDVVNAHPVILVQYAKTHYKLELTEVKKYIDNRDEYLKKIDDNRDEAKTAVIKIMYGGKNEYEFLEPFKTEILLITEKIWTNPVHAKLRTHCETQPNSKGSFLSFILQTEERRIMLSMRNYFATAGWSVDVLSYDGIMIRKNPKLTFNKGLLEGAETQITYDTEYNVKLVNKKFNVMNLDDEKTDIIEDRNPTLSHGTIVDDLYAAKIFASLMGKNIILDSGRIYIFNDKTGLWSDKEADLKRLISGCGDKLVFYVDEGNHGMVSTFNYSGSVRNSANLITKLPDVLKPQDGYFLQRVESDIGYLLFEDGIYDFKSGNFKQGFDRNIIFRASCPRKFTERNQTIIDEINLKSFIDPFIGTEHSNILKHNLMRALIGDYKRKKMVVGLGFRNSGKGMLIQLTQTAFGNYVGTFNGDDLIAAVDGSESARKMGWVKNIAPKRFAFGSEISLGRSVNANTLKSLTSGGDYIKSRALYENENDVVNKSTLFLFAQEMPPVKPSADCVRGRIHAIEWAYSYVEHPTEPQHKLADSELSTRYHQDEYGAAFFWVLVDEYEKWRSDGFKEPVLPEAILNTLDDIVPVTNVMEIIKSGFQITKNNEDYVPTRDIQAFLKMNGCTESETSVGRSLTAYGINVKQKKIDGKNIKVRVGIKDMGAELMMSNKE